MRVSPHRRLGMSHLPLPPDRRSRERKGDLLVAYSADRKLAVSLPLWIENPACSLHCRDDAVVNNIEQALRRARDRVP